MICFFSSFLFLIVTFLFLFFFFFFNDTATTEIYTLSLHDALPISSRAGTTPGCPRANRVPSLLRTRQPRPDRKSTRLNSSHSQISYAVFCLKKKKKKKKNKKKNDTKTQHTKQCYKPHKHISNIKTH